MPTVSDYSDQLLIQSANGNAEKLALLRARVAAGEPAAYVAGFLEFAGHRFKIDQRAYITDPEAQNLVRVVIEQGSQLASVNAALNILEFGVGAATLAITIKLAHPEWTLSGIDIDATALDLAAENAASFGVDIPLYQSDFLAGWPLSPPDIVFGDPPWGGSDDLYDSERDEHYYLQMPAASTFPPDGERTGIHDELIRRMVALDWNSLLILNYGILPIEVIARSAAPLRQWQLVHPQPEISVLIGRV